MRISAYSYRVGRHIITATPNLFLSFIAYFDESLRPSMAAWRMKDAPFDTPIFW